ncbi:endoribonuclease YbeY [Marivirga lumbricoides]|uniref:Endoribonuclease YbeY n=1 Tax=Marivirga lumbricoides TaxID=1046115 RepID=A0ABQ1MFN3_9BACT|nr:endoribonuclease YbeY [Marivirga lumbricoides]
MPLVNFFKEDVKIDLRSLRKYRKWINEVAQSHHKEIELINYIFCSDEYLHQINQGYLNHDTYTDIITFDLREHSSEEPIEADIFISIERVQDNSQIQSTSFSNELERVIIHGLLHLVGFKDKTQQEKDLMRKEETKALQLLY